MDLPLGVLCAGEGAVWAWGSHGGMAATARFEGRSWSLKTHPRLSWAAAAGYAALDGSVWFGAAVNWRREEGHVGGVVRYDGQTWRHDRPPDAPEYVYGSGQTADGRMWFGGRDLRWFDGSSWTAVASPEGLASRYCDAVHAGRNGELWVGHRSNGAFCFDGRTWRRYDVRDGLADNHVRAIVEAGDGGVWAATPEGVSRFDPSAGAGQAQRAWVTQALPPGLEAHVVGGGLRQGGDGALWINYFESGQGRPPRVWTVRYGPDARPPETEITLSVDEVSQPGNTTLAWMGADAWRTTVGEELEYAWRLDGGAWSAFTRQRSRIFQSLSSGRHRFEVKARDRDFTEDPTPAVVEFTVVPPVWRQPWFVGLVLAFSGVTAFQGSRIVVRDRKLKEANTALSAANRELFAVNSELENEIAEREQAECERAVLDVRLQQLRYLYRLREALGDARTPDEAVRAAGGLVMEALSAAGWGGLCVRQNGREWRFGDVVEDGRSPSYERPIAWGGKRWGTFRLQCGVALSEAQERALVDETAGQIAHVLEARELEMQLLNSARLVSMGQMTAGVAHELGQPMTVIAARAGDVRCRLMQDLDLPDEKLKEMMEDVLDMVDRMDGMVDHMRVFSRDTSQEPRVPFSLNEAVRAGLKMVGAQLGNHGIEVALDLAEGLPRVCGHSNRMEQVVLNLLNNARDALDEKKAGDRALRKRLCVRTRPGDDGVREVVLEVEDNGIGMDAAAVERAVEPFYTTKDASRGTGLGLSISYAIVQSHGGRISCESREGEGTTFRVVLPAVDGG